MTTEAQNQIFLEWVENYGAILWKIARIHAPPGEHADLHQDLLIALWKATALYRGQAQPSTFIYRLAFNRALNWRRDRETYHRRHLALNEMPVETSRSTSDTAEREQRVDELYAALYELSDSDRSIALMYLEDMSYRDMSAVLGITESNVGVKVSRMKKRLSAILQRFPTKTETT